MIKKNNILPHNTFTFNDVLPINHNKKTLSRENFR